MGEKYKSHRLFSELADDLKKIDPSVIDRVRCPLCLTDFSRESINKLSVEHVIASKLGGKTKTLTCKSCNNSQGARLDRHLVSAMKAMDGLEGTHPLRTIWHRPEGVVIGETLLQEGTRSSPITTRIIAEASKPDALQAIPDSLRDGSTISFSLNFDFVPRQYWMAAFRAAYLAVFCVEGYAYVVSEGAKQVRSVIHGHTPVNSKLIMQARPDSEPPGDHLVMPFSFKNLGECFAVLLRLKTKRARYLNVFLPGKLGYNWDALGDLYRYAPKLRIETTPLDWTSTLYIYLGYDPVSELGEGQGPVNRLKVGSFITGQLIRDK